MENQVHQTETKIKSSARKKIQEVRLTRKTTETTNVDIYLDSEPDEGSLR